MKLWNIHYRITAFLLTGILMIHSIPGALATDTSQTGSITGNFELSNVTFHLYSAGSFDQKSQVSVLGGVFEGLSVDPNDEDAATTLSAYTEGKDSIIATSDENGGVKFDNLTQGVYLLTGEAVYNADDQRCVIQPAMITIPQIEGNEADWNPNVYIKGDLLYSAPAEKTVTLDVTKIWDDNNDAADKRPTEIKIELLRDNTVYDTVQLSEENGWSHSWSNLEARYVWLVREAEIPDTYTEAIKLTDSGYVIKNTSTEMVISPSPVSTIGTASAGSSGTIPQTGLIWWPAVLMLFLGVGCLMVSKKVNRNKK